MSTSASYATVVQELYVAYFGRPADPTGLQNFEAALAAANAPTTMSGLLAAYNTNPAVTSLVNAFGNSGESGRLYGTNIASSLPVAENFVTAVFESLFNRAPLQAGLTFWSNAITSGSVTPGEAALAIAAAAGTADTATVANKVAAASAFTADLTSHGSAGLTTYQGATEAGYGRAFIATVNGTTTPTSFDANAAATVNVMVNGGVPTQTPTPTPTPVSSTVMALTVSGDTIVLNNTTAASTITLHGADLTNYPASSFGTLALLLPSNIHSVTDTGGNFTLSAAGNSSATTFNFSTGVVSGASAAASAGIPFSGVTTYITSDYADTVTLSAATQNVTASNDTQTINLGNLAYTGTLNLNAGSGGTDTINATLGSNLLGANIQGTGGNAHIALVLSAAGNETLTTEEYNLITSTTAGSITFTGGTFGTDRVTFSDAGTVTSVGNVGNYTLAQAGNTITLLSVGDFVTGDANGGNDVVNLGSLTYIGTAAFGSGGTDSIHVVIGGNISGGTITTQGASVGLVLSNFGTETLNAAEYNLLNIGGITGGTFGGNTVNLTTAATIVDSLDIQNYVFLGATNSLTMTHNANDAVTGGSGVDTLVISAASYTGTSNLEAGANVLDVTHAGATNLSTAAVTATGGSVGLKFDSAAAQNVTLTVAEYSGYATITDGLGAAATSTVTLTTASALADSAAIDNYVFANGTNTLGMNNNTADNVTGGSGVDTLAINLASYTGTSNLEAGANLLDVTHAGATNLSAAVVTATGGTVGLVFDNAGAQNITLTAAEYNGFATITDGAGTAATSTVTLATASTALTDFAAVDNYILANGTNTFTLVNNPANANDAVTGGSGVDTLVINGASYTGTSNLGAGANLLDITGAGATNLSSAAVTATGGTVGLVFDNASSQNITMTLAEYDGFATITDGAGSSQSSTVTLTTASASITDSAAVNIYAFANGTNTLAMTHNTNNNVTGGSGVDTLVMSLASYVGVSDLGAGANLLDVTHAGATDLSAAAVTATGGTVGLVFDNAAAQNITLTVAEYNGFATITDGAGAAATSTVTFSDTGTVTANASVYNYDLSAAGNSITLNNVADNVTGTPSTDNNIYLGSLAYAGTLTLAPGSLDIVYATIGGDLSAATINGPFATAVLTLSADGTETLSVAEYNQFNVLNGITFTGTAGAPNDTIVFSGAGTVTDNANVGNYDLSAAGNTITLNHGVSNVTGAASGNDVVDLSSLLTYAGTLAFGTSGADAIHVSGNGDISSATISAGGTATVGLVLGGGVAGETMTTEQYNFFSSISGGVASTNMILFADTGTVSDNADVGMYQLANGSNTFNLNHASDVVWGSGSGGDAFNINVGNFTGTINLGSSGVDTFNIDLTSNKDISGGTITYIGTQADLVTSGSGTLTVNSSEANTFHIATAAIVAPGVVEMDIADSTRPINLNAHENALTAVVLLDSTYTVNVSVGAASVNGGAAGFNQTIFLVPSIGDNTFNLDNGAATITGASDATHFVTINGFNPNSDNLVLTLSGVDQNGTPQSISDTGGDAITAANNGVIYLTTPSMLSGYVLANANDLTSAETNILAAVDTTTASTGVYTFVIDTNNGAAVYQTHFTGSTLDGIQLVGVATGDVVVNLVGHIH